MNREHIRALVHYRLDQADNSVRAAHVLLEQQFPRDVVNRAYYGMFYAVLALLVTKQLGTSRHQGVISLFDREFVRTGVFDRELSTWLHTAFDMRRNADYKEMVDVPQDEAQAILHYAASFVSRVKTYLDHLLADSSEAEDRDSGDVNHDG